MENKTVSLKASNDALSNSSQESPSTIVVNKEPFLSFDPKSTLSFEDKSAIYSSLVALVQAECPFDKVLQDRAVRFLESIEPKWGEPDYPAKLVHDLVPSSAGSPPGFLASILTLLSSPHSTVVAAALSFLYETTKRSSPAIRCRLMESDLITKVLAIVQPHTLSVAGNETIFHHLTRIINHCISLADRGFLITLSTTEAVNIYKHREMNFQKVVLPSSQCVTFLISNRHILSGDLFDSFMSLLNSLIQICPFHHPTLEFVFASPIAMAFSNCLSLVEDENHLLNVLIKIDLWLSEWKKEGPEVSQSGKRMMQSLFSEGFEDTLEQMMKHEKRGDYYTFVVHRCNVISQKQGLNVKRQ
ncbi:hypothetical protein BLNAU_7293 [Blattamonas nauphoetae]|uniref:Uncharacterized protein n=1 Tax=Blattamonas nauphoetae TaxID=2049346 RepID=A0ABQ9Y2C5_9EUKA|nr:hypothetical protein BLNAU_7293 [Blattamonas nauphoetae]